MHKQPLPFHILILLLRRLSTLSPKHQLRPQLPLQWNVPMLLRLLVNDGIVVLQARTEPFLLESSP